MSPDGLVSAFLERRTRITSMRRELENVQEQHARLEAQRRDLAAHLEMRMDKAITLGPDGQVGAVQVDPGLTLLAFNT